MFETATIDLPAPAATSASSKLETETDQTGSDQTRAAGIGLQFGLFLRLFLTAHNC